ncbi:MAG: hypothetical protein C4520_10145 [Candidatus Abyssobacteria bacterium SURF_5]|uniref:Uncharacterized protein n=1 Tax=Abyssobacteria bacterium (strain SURF_5) TaxID=2093360 RepID=A0A3A4P038_ABYX5|nr:MAG: hypothetical protein C4520_10145 [Candidatus Abyssubacteria bacterium SURF_5]
MKYYVCDMCGVRIELTELRYVLKMNIFAAYDTMKIEPSDLERDYEEEIQRLVEKMEAMNPKELEEDVFKHFTFDLCRSCQQKFLRSPLGAPERAAGENEFPPFDVDDFLRRLDDN